MYYLIIVQYTLKLEPYSIYQHMFPITISWLFGLLQQRRVFSQEVTMTKTWMRASYLTRLG